MNNQRLHRTNSFIRNRKERAGLTFIKKNVIKEGPQEKAREFVALF
jgi:hypothetical protein